jgi:hypothetical protein
MFASELRMEKRPSATARLLVRVRATGDSAGSITKVGTRWHAVDAFMEQAQDFKTRNDALRWLAKVYRDG